MKNKVCIVVMIITVFMLSQFSILIGSVKAETVTGSDGDVSWSFDSESGTLTFSGSGEITQQWKQSISNKENIKKVVINSGITGIGNYAFDYGSLDGLQVIEIEIPDSVTTIGNNAFLGCTKLRNIEIPNGVTSIGEWAFYKCIGLTELKIPNSVKTIGASAFNMCTGLENIEIQEGISTIGNYAFYRCKGLKNINIPSSVTTIGVGVFSGESELTSIEVNEKNEQYCSIDGVLYSKDMREIICYPAGKGENYKIINGVTSINASAFDNCYKLTSIEIPNSTISIGDDAFRDCYRLENLEIPNSVSTIGQRAFLGCFSLINIEIPNSVAKIDSWAFNSCYLASVIIQNTDIIIGQAAFYSSPISGYEGITIYCKENSTAKQYAEENNIKYVIDDDAPTITTLKQEDKYINITATDNNGVGLADEAYSLDNKSWSTSNKLAVEKSGTYTVYVRDMLGNTATKTIDVVLGEKEDSNKSDKDGKTSEKEENGNAENTANAETASTETTNVEKNTEDKTQAKTVIPQAGATFPIIILTAISIIGFVGYKKFKKINY